MSRRLQIIVLLVLCALGSNQAWGQIRSSTITGSVTDSSGAAVPEATVTVVNQDTNAVTHTTSGSAGEFTVPYLPSGNYSVQVDKPGFQPKRQTDIVLGSEQSVRVSMALTLGTLQSVVEVKADAMQLQTENSTVQGAVDDSVISNIPNTTSNPLLYATLQAGVTPHNGMLDTTSPNAFGIGYWSHFQFSAFSVNGGAAFTNDIQLDGLSVQGSAWNDATVLPNPDALQEVRVNVNNFAADLGRGQGVVSMMTKSGGNEFHGGANYTIRRDALNANGFSNNALGVPRGNFTVDQFGGNLGGAIIKNKLFFFTSYEGLLHANPETWMMTVPTAEERVGNFSQHKISDQNGNPISAMVFDPYNVTKAGDNLYQRAPVPNATVPNPNAYALKIYGSYPLPNRTPTDAYGANNFFTQKSQDYVRNSSNNRIDYRLGKHSIYGTGGLESGSIKTPRPYGADSPFYAFPGDWSAENARDKNPYAAIGDTIVVSPTLVVDLRYGITRIHTENVSGLNSSFDYSAYGMPANLQTIVPYPGVAPELQPGGYTWLSADNSQQKRDYETNHTLAGSATKVKNRWTFKAGTELRVDLSNYTDFQVGGGKMDDGANYTQQFGDIWGNSVGSMNKTPQQGGLAQADMMLGADSFVVPAGFSMRPALAQKLWSLYSQNDWHATNKLTVNLGLRWEVQPGPTERYNRVSDIDLTAANPFSGQGAFAFPGVNGYSRNLWDTHYTDFQPRIGFAYRLTNTFVMRGGYGRSYTPTNTGYYDGPYTYGTTPFSDYSQQRLYGTTATGMPAGHFWDANTVQIYQATGAQQLPGMYGTNGYPFFDRTNTLDGHVDQWNFFLEKRFGGSWLVSAGYAGSHGANLANARQPFQSMQNISDSTLDQWRQTYISSNGSTLPSDTQVANPCQPASGGLLPFSGYLGNTTVSQWQAMMPYPCMGTGDTVQRTNGNSSYNALQLHVNHAFSSGFQLQAHYTWSKTLDTTWTDLQGNQGFSDNTGQGGWDLRNLSNDRQLSSSDIPHRFLAVATYDLPFGKGKAVELKNSLLRAVGGQLDIRRRLHAAERSPVRPQRMRWVSERPLQSLRERTRRSAVQPAALV